MDPSRHLQSYLVSFSNHRDTSATFRDCQRPSVPIDTCMELSGPSQHTSGTLSFIRGLLQTIWTHQDIFRAMRLLSATIKSHQLLSRTVRDPLYPSTHVWMHLVLVSTLPSYLASFSNHRDASATFRDCQRPSVSIDTYLKLSGPCQHTSRPLSFIQGLSKSIWTYQDIFGAIWLLSAPIGTHQLHSGTVRDHLYDTVQEQRPIWVSLRWK